MQFGMDQDVPSDVPRFNETKITAWKYYCRLTSDKKLYFPPRLFEADVTTRYAMWWKQSVLGNGDFVKNIVKRKRSESSRKHRPHLGKTNRSSNDVGVPPGFPPNLVDLLKYRKFCHDVPAGSSSPVCTTADENIDAPAMSVEDSKPVLKIFVFLKEQYLKNQEELGRLARQQDKMLRLMNLMMKRLGDMSGTQSSKEDEIQEETIPMGRAKRKKLRPKWLNDYEVPRPTK